MKRKPFIPGEREALAIQEITRISHTLSRNALETITSMRKMTELLCELRRTDSDPEIQKLLDRLQELSYLENSQEFQSWQITVGQVMDRAWKRLP